MLSTSRRLLGYFRRYWIMSSSVWLRQGSRWVELRRDEIAAVKFETISRIIVRSYGGERIIVSLMGFSGSSYDAVCRSLRDALRHNEETRGLWAGAEVLKY